MKALYHIPTEQYGFVECEVEVASVEDAIESYNALKTLKTASGEGLDDKTWRSAIDEYLLTNELKDGTNLYERMNSEQQRTMQEIKKALKRIKNKE